ncbi:MAG TPA: restriction endonuclease subunit S [Pseudolysinimonas sp.]|nr:restriction endonuclease subunit S [Pseudolysinimonas sp.]
MTKLAEIAEINPRPAPDLNDHDQVSFLGMADVSEDGATSRGHDRQVSTVRKGFTSFLDGDLLVAKITPCFENGKIAQASLKHRVGFGSTEFHVVRPHPRQADARYLLHFLRSPGVRESGERRMTGSAGQRRVPKDFLEGLDVPLPPLPEQRRIASILDEVDVVRASRLRSVSYLGQLVTILFNQLSGQPERTVKLGEVLSIRAKMVDPRDDAYAELPLVAPDNIEPSTGRIFGVRQVRQVQPISGKYMFAETDVLYSKIRPALNKVAMAEGVGLCSADMYPLTVNRSHLTREYLWVALRAPAFLSYANRLGNRAQMPKLNRRQLLSYRIGLPSIERQRGFADVVQEHLNASLIQRDHLAKLDELFASLQYRAFRGEL